jgi:hypothetical protein
MGYYNNNKNKIFKWYRIIDYNNPFFMCYYSNSDYATLCLGKLMIDLYFLSFIVGKKFNLY